MKKLAIILALLTTPCVYAQVAIQGSNIQIGGQGSATSPLTTKGDLYGYSTTNVRIPVGSNGQILSADSSQAAGIKWLNFTPTSINGTSGAFTFSGSVTCTGTSCVFTGGGSSGFPITLGATSIAANSTTTTVTGLTLDGVTPTTFGFVDPTSSIQTQLTSKAPLASPTFTGTPAAPTASPGDNTTQLATDAFVHAAIAALNFAAYTGSFTAGHCLDVQAVGPPVVIQDAGAACGSGGGGITQLTADGTAGPGSGSQAFTLATVNSNVGTFGDATHTVTVTANAKGLTTAISSNAIPTAASGTNGLGSPDNSTIKTTAGVYTVQNTTINSIACTPGSTCTLAPALSYDYRDTATCVGGSPFPDLGYYNASPPTVVCVAPATSSAAGLDFLATPTNPQYAQDSATLPAFWTSTNAYLYFYTTATTGNVTFTIQTGCVASGSTVGAPSWSSGVSVTTTVPGTGGNQGNTAIFTGIAAAGVNSCPSAATIPSQMVFRIFRGTDTAAADVILTGLTLVSARTQ